MRKFKLGIIFGGLVLALQAQAGLDISYLNTGAGLYGGPAGTIDPNWTVSAIFQAHPPGPAPVTGAAYLVPNNQGFPIPPWIDNSQTSSWVSYSSPLQIGDDFSGSVYQYQASFKATDSGTIGVRWLSDNASQLFVNGNLIGSRPDPFDPATLDGSTFTTWNNYQLFNVLAGTTYTIDLDVYNTPYPAGNPSAGRVEFITAVPEASTMIAGALLLLPFGAGAIRSLRKNATA